MEYLKSNYEEYRDIKSPSLYLSLTENENENENENNNNNEIINPSVFNSFDRRMNQSSTLNSVNLEDSVWKPDFKNSWNFGQPRCYYDTESMIRNDLEDTTQILKNNIGKLTERDIKLENIENNTENLLTGAQKFKIASKSLKNKMFVNYILHVISLIILVIFIIMLIIILLK